MVALATVRHLSIVADERGVDETKAKLQQLAQAQGGIVVSSDRMERSTISVDRALDKLRRSTDAAYRDSQKFEAGQKTLGRALDSGRIDLVEYNRQLDLLSAKYRNADRAQAGLATGAGRLGGAMSSLRGFGGGLVAGTIVSQLINLPRTMRDIAAETGGIKDAADQIGITSERLQELRFAAEQSGVEISELDGSMSQFSRRIGEAATGQGDLYKILAANNVELRNADGSIRPLNGLLGDFANLVKNAASEQDRLVLVTEAFGRGGAGMVNMLSGGAAGLRLLSDEARTAGAVLDGMDVDRLAELDDQLVKISRRARTVLKEQAVEAAEAFDTLEAGFARVPGMARSAWEGAEYYYNRLFSISPEEAAANKLRAGLAKASATGEYGQAEDYSNFVQFGQATKGDRLDYMPPRTTLPRKPAREPGGLSPEDRDAERERKAAAQAAHQRRLEALEAAQERVTVSIDRSRDAAQGFAETLIGGIRNGEGVLGSLANAVDDLGNRLTDLAMNSAFDALFGKRGAGGGGLLSSLFGGFGSLAAGGLSSAAMSAVTAGAGTFMLEDGGVMTSRGLMKLNRYSRGGIADRPQLAMFGEGRRPEAFVPLPDGRSIPVTMQGAQAGGVVVNLTTNVDARGSQITEAQFAAMLDQRDQRIRRELPAMVQNARGRGQL